MRSGSNVSRVFFEMGLDALSTWLVAWFLLLWPGCVSLVFAPFTTNPLGSVNWGLASSFMVFKFLGLYLTFLFGRERKKIEFLLHVLITLFMLVMDIYTSNDDYIEHTIAKGCFFS